MQPEDTECWQTHHLNHVKKKISPHLPMMLSRKEVRLLSKELKATILKILKRLIQNLNLECVTKKKKKKPYILNKEIAWFGNIKIEHRYLEEISTWA